MKKFLAFLFGLVVLVIVAALVGPTFVDWNEYKPEIAAEIKSRTGRDLVIEGDIDFAVLPAPTLSVNDLRLANIEGAASPDMVSLKALRVRIALTPLFEGIVQVETIALIEPVIEFEVLPDGRRNWEFGPAAGEPEEAAPAEPEPGAEPGARRAPSRVRLDRFRIENGTLTYLDSATGTIERIDGLDAEISAETLTGPFRAQGDMVARGLPVEFELAVGSFTERQPVIVNMKFAFPSAKAEARFSGNFSEPSAEGALSGSFEAEGNDLRRLVQALMAAASPEGAATPDMPGFVAQKFALEGALSASAEALEVNDIAFRLGDTRATGALNATFGPPLQADVALSFNRIDLDRWLAMEPPAGEDEGQGAGEPKPGAAPAPAPGKAEFALPGDVKASLDLSVDALVFKEGGVRQAKVSAALDKGVLTLNQASALLPGGSDVSLSGTLTAKDGAPAVDGNVEAMSDNLRGVFDWLGIDASSVPPDRLRKFSFTGKVKGTPAQLDLTEIDLRLDASRLTGGVAIALRERPAFGARLEVDRFNLDAYLPPKPEKEEAKPKKAPARAPASLSPNKEEEPILPALALLNAFDANVDAKIGSLTVNRMEVRGLRFDGTLQDGELTVRDAGVTDFAGTALTFSGSAKGFGKTPLLDAAFEVSAEDVARLLRAVAVEPPSVSERVGRVALEGTAKGRVDNLELDAALQAAEGRVSVKGVMGVRDQVPRFDLAVAAAHPDLVKLVRLFAEDYRPAAEKLGDFSLKARVSGDAAAAQISGLSGKVGPVNVAGDITVRLDGPRPKITAALSTSEIVADLFLPARPSGSGAKPRAGAGKPAPKRGNPGPQAPPGERWSKEPLDLSALRAVDADVRLAAPAISYGKYRVVKPQLVLALDAGALEVRQLTGTMFEGAFDLKGRLMAADVPSLAGTVTVANANIHEALFVAGDIDVAEGRLNFNMEMGGAGRSPFELVSSLGGKGGFNVVDGVVRGFDLAAVSERLKSLDSAESYLAFLASSMKGGQTRFTRLDGTFAIDRGVIRSDDIHLLAQASEGRAVAVVDLPRWFIDMQAEFFLTEHPKAPPVGMRVVGPLDAPQRKIETDRMQAFLLQRGVGTLLRKVLPKGIVPAEPAPAPEGAPAQPEEPLGLESLFKKILPKEIAPAEPAPAPAQPAPAPAQPAPAPEPVQPEPGPVQPEDVIKNLLKGLKF